MAPELLSRCADLLYREAAALDERRWEEWLALYTEDAEFWLPAWDEDGRPTGDPQSHLSLIYYSSRAGLEDRVWRIQSGLSPASSPLIRTCHLLTNVRITDVVNGQPHVSSHWQVQIYRPEKQQTSTYFGFYEHVLRLEGDSPRIAKKKIILLNDVVESVLDINHV
ncbi:MAG TPA: aromatic-ring-hydroxylating dioxygenase subunit beta [Candidatus Binatia bacterium]|jgi:3-phenylpropionate/cinnamic acid dioxygenase small subunit|nr:aromatic-ring-hydroxylating dioxygenase subunit beta [Candidatus Binatia bacterium]